ncbi:Uu.00g036490.m01.CDS01 [Anthostomella pinea]|uniref:Uu.00g036490.m01.CDS01 n=1 Tax=Anthostomella pinea TaxID=933095 RepID=A0AAI8V9G2_9PEZI|nr:Uu.00g036490.m01.CDS01 [Anthostomella pinea]
MDDLGEDLNASKARLIVDNHAEVWGAGDYKRAGNGQARDVSTRQNGHSDDLERVLTEAIRVILPVWRTIPKKVLFKESGLQTILSKIRMRFSLRIRAMDNMHPLVRMRDGKMESQTGPRKQETAFPEAAPKYQYQNQNPDVSPTSSPIASLTRSVFQRFASLASVLSTEGSEGYAEHAARVVDDTTRFRIWADNIGAHHPASDARSAEARPRDATEVAERVSHILAELRDDLDDAYEACTASEHDGAAHGEATSDYACGSSSEAASKLGA